MISVVHYISPLTMVVPRYADDCDSISSRKCDHTVESFASGEGKNIFRNHNYGFFYYGVISLAHGDELNCSDKR